ncbi:hypothetical protein ASD21_06390 [Caulobacter sp. Root1455]|uniref:hypothetical protein n=1 Tax=unclassified Caulobacter TaxID=2648921 RepID=UPI0006FEC989|nr:MULTISPECIES: hypothetical protein [unclassified Caulobacter]KQY29286.1 hypothetical protein ASD38_07980 [Caulobacter sp. Root487D2Y]KQY96127.1 hypothetical protein ASD21_06390 [Caulobacter sp. Root1455]
MTARPKQILLWAATGLIWLGAFVGGPTLIALPFVLPLLKGPWLTPSGIDLLLLIAFSALWLAALIWIGLVHRGKARLAHFVVAGVITGAMFLPGLFARPQTNPTAELYRVL